jgi:hypothetical protein
MGGTGFASALRQTRDGIKIGIFGRAAADLVFAAAIT